MLCQTANYSTSMNLLPVLACQLFKINYLHIFFHDSRSNIDSLAQYKIIVMNIDKKICFYLKFTQKNLEKLTHSRPALWTKTY